jgi:pyridoxine kinase
MPSPRNILSIQSEVVVGHVGNSAARFALQLLGCEAWCVPTVLLSSHAAHKGVAGEPISTALVEKLLGALEVQGHLAECDGVLSGYLGSAEQAALVAATVARAKAVRPGLLYCLDPAFGDDGRVYARPGVAEAMAEKLLPLADIITPNVFELSVLAERPVTDIADALAAAEALNRPIVVVTSVPDGDRLGTLIVTGGDAWLASAPSVENPPHGVGDLIASLLFARLVAGTPAVTALDLATRTTYHVLSVSAGAPEMNLIAEQQALLSPPTPAGYRLVRLETRRRAIG